MVDWTKDFVKKTALVIVLGVVFGLIGVAMIATANEQGQGQGQLQTTDGGSPAAHSSIMGD